MSNKGKNSTKAEAYRFIRVNGTMKKVKVSGADEAFDAAMKVRSGRRKSVEKELQAHGVTS